MRRFISSSLTLVLVAAAPVHSVTAQDPYDASRMAFSAEQLDNLLAPIALYPDPILAQALVAATFPDQIQAAADFVRANGTRDVDDQEWDVSVKAIAHYPPVLNMMAEREDWTIALGQAYAGQSSDVMDAVQRLRVMARAQGNLQSTPEQSVVVTGNYVTIVPAQPTVIYVPTYDPTVIYYRPIRYYDRYEPYWSFGIGFPIGVWLTYDVDWYGRRVFYDGWHGGGWRLAARPYIRFTPAYVHPRFSLININIDIFRRRVDYVRLGRYNAVHRGSNFDNRRDRGWDGRNGLSDDRRGPPRGAGRAGGRDDRVIDRTPPAGGRSGRSGGNGRNDAPIGRGGSRQPDRPSTINLPGRPGTVRPERPAVVPPSRPGVVRPERVSPPERRGQVVRPERAAPPDRRVQVVRPERPAPPERRAQVVRPERPAPPERRVQAVRPERVAAPERRPEVRVDRGRPENRPAQAGSRDRRADAGGGSSRGARGPGRGRS